MPAKEQTGIRTFLAIPLTEALERAVDKVQKELDEETDGVRWTRPGNRHLTLRFFGETAQEDLEKIKVSMLSVKRIQRPFAVEVRGLGAFPTPGRPRVLWLGLTPRAPLQGLYRTCQEELQKLGVAPETRPFAPHLTIGRIRRHGSDLRRLTESYAARSFGELPVSQIVLYESRLRKSGAEHIPIENIELSGNDLPVQ